MALIPVSEKDTVPVVTKPKFTVVGKEEVIKVARAAKYIPVIPTGNGCCPDICRYINEDIDMAERELEKRSKEMKLTTTGHGKAKIRRQRYSLTNRLDVLEDFRIIMKEHKICECINYTDK